MPATRVGALPRPLACGATSRRSASERCQRTKRQTLRSVGTLHVAVSGPRQMLLGPGLRASPLSLLYFSPHCQRRNVLASNRIKSHHRDYITELIFGMIHSSKRKKKKKSKCLTTSIHVSPWWSGLNYALSVPLDANSRVLHKFSVTVRGMVVILRGEG